MDTKLQASRTLPAADVEAIEHLKRAIAGGKHWYLALLEAIGLWTSAEEVYNGRHYLYLIDGEAFDWLALAERLCESVDGLVPEDEKVALLFHGCPPLNLAPDEFEKLIGSKKYRQYLNYFYGVTVEEALVLAVQEEVRKERQSVGLVKKAENINEVYRRIYGATRAALLKQFRRESAYPQAEDISLTELREFTYWLFKYRVKHSEKARVASDTKKGLDVLRQQCAGRGQPIELASTFTNV